MALCPSCPPIIAVQSVPISEMDLWKGIGANTLFLRETQNGLFTQAQWRQQAATKGFKYIDYPSADLAADDADPNLIAFVLPLYPDRNGQLVSTWSTVYSAIRAASGKPVLGMFGGSSLTTNMNASPPYNGSVQIPFMPYCDWVGQDWLPENSDPAVFTPQIISDAMRLLGGWSSGKPQLAMVETCFSNFSAPGRAPTTLEMKTEVRNVMAHPASNGWIFNVTRQAGGSYAYASNGTDAPMRTAMTEIINEFLPTAVAKVVYATLYTDGTYVLA